MTFDAPAGLLFLGALPVILWMHLRRRWPHRAVVPSLTPWSALRSAWPRQRRRVPPAVLLVLHLTAAALAGLSVGRPRLPGASEDALDRAVVLDVTSSMGAGSRWPAALIEAQALLGSTRGQATLVTLGPQPRVLVARDEDGRAAKAALRSLAPGGTRARTDEALDLAAAVAGPGAEIVVVSDGGVSEPGPDAPPARWVLVGEPVDNVAIIDAAARRTGGEVRLFARVASFAAAGRSVDLTLHADDRLVDDRTFELDPGQTVELVWRLPEGAQTSEVRLAGNDALAADDVAVVPLEGSAIWAQLIGDSPTVARALAAMPDVRLERAGLGTYRMDGSALSVFVGAVPDELPLGGVLLFNPPPSALFEAGSSSESAAVGPVGDHELVAGLDLSGVVLAGVGDPELPPWATVVLEAGGRSAVFAGTPGQSRVVVFAFDPDAGNLSERLAFPLLVARAANWADPVRLPTVVSAGTAVRLPPSALRVQTPRGRRERAHGVFSDTGEHGLYVARGDTVGEGRIMRFAVLAGDARESDLRRRLVQPPPPTLARTPSSPGGRPLWRPLAALALGVVLAEGLWRASDRVGRRASVEAR